MAGTVRPAVRVSQYLMTQPGEFLVTTATNKKRNYAGQSALRSA
jgi:hypothetical protein